MYKKVINYKDLDNNSVSAEWHFSLDSAELLEMKLSVGTGLSAALEVIMAGGDKTVIMQAFRELLMNSVGRRVGNRFVKNDDLRSEFKETGAYAALYMEFVTNIMSGIDFLMGVVPGDLANKLSLPDVREQMAAAGLLTVDTEQILEQIQKRVGEAPPMKMIPESERQVQLVDMTLDPASHADNVNLITRRSEIPPSGWPTETEAAKEPSFFRGKTKAELEAMPIDELTDLITSSSGNVPNELLRFAMRKRHAS